MVQLTELKFGKLIIIHYCITCIDFSEHKTFFFLNTMNEKLKLIEAHFRIIKLFKSMQNWCMLYCFFLGMIITGNDVHIACSSFIVKHEIIYKFVGAYCQTCIKKLKKEWDLCMFYNFPMALPLLDIVYS